MFTLIVVDMQARFPESLGNGVQENCKRAIRRAVKSGAAIIFVEYQNHGPTLPSLTKLVRGYDKVYHVVKDQWDGSLHSYRIIKDAALRTSKIKVCGVYTDCCVQATVEGLSQILSKSRIEVLSKACASINKKNHVSGLRVMKRLPNVKVWGQNK